MTEFFSLFLTMFKELVAFHFTLPFMDGFSFGDVLVAVAVLGVVTSALIGQLKSFNLRHEAYVSDPDAMSVNDRAARDYFKKNLGDDSPWVM